MNFLESIFEDREENVEGIYIRVPANVKINGIFKKYLSSSTRYGFSSKNKIVDVEFFINVNGTYAIDIYLKDEWKDTSRLARSRYRDIPEVTVKMIIDKLLRLKGVVHKQYSDELCDSNDSHCQKCLKCKSQYQNCTVCSVKIRNIWLCESCEKKISTDSLYLHIK